MSGVAPEPELSRDEAFRRFRNRAMVCLYPVAVLLIVAAFVTRALWPVLGMLALTIGWNAYFLLIWRPRFNERYPTPTGQS